MIQKFLFTHKGVFFKNKFVLTDKYLEEEKAQKFLYPTWTTQASGGRLKKYISQF